MLSIFLLPFSLVAGTANWWRERAIRATGMYRGLALLSNYRLGRQLVRAYEQHESVRIIVDRLSNFLPLKAKYLYYRNTLHRTLEFKNVWSRGVVGGFVNRNFVGQQPPVRHGTARVSLILGGRKIPLKPRRHRTMPPNVRGGARFRSRQNRSGLGV